MFDIPFIVWLSDEFKEHYSKSADRFVGILDRKYQTDDLIHSIIDISGCYSDDFDASRSIFHADFLSRTRFMGDFDYDELIKTRKSVID
jgi:heptose-I-phosphate ethanolaminephosphotransferase